jgi:hypothetical protein
VSPPGVRGGGGGRSERYSFLGLGKEKQSALLTGFYYSSIVIQSSEHSCS